MQDTKYKEFQARLIPNIDSGRIMGVRLPILRKLAKKIEAQAFLNELPKKYFEEDLLQGIIISNIKDYQSCIEKLENFVKAEDYHQNYLEKNPNGYCHIDLLDKPNLD